MSKLGDKLNFNSMKSSAMGTRSISSAIPPRSGVQFAPGTVIEFELPGNRPNEFIDLNNNLKFKLPVVTTAVSTLDRSGAYGFINKLEFIQKGVVLCSIPKYNVLLTALSDLQMSAEYKSTVGRVQEGFEGDCLRGAILPVGSRTFYLSPLASDLSMTTPHRSHYLGTNANITVRLTLESASVAFQGAGNYSVVQPQMLMETTFLERETMDALSKAVGGEYKMLCNSYDHMSAVIPAGTTASHIKLSFQKASLERCLFTIRPLAHTTDATKFSLGSRGTGNLASFQLEIGGVDYPQTPIQVGEDSMYHVLKADNIASNYQHGLCGLMNAYTADAHADGSGTSSLGGEPQVSKNNPYILPGADADGDDYGKGKNATVSSSSNIGTFVGAVNLESSLTTSQNSPLYSGLNTMNGVDIYFKANWSGVITGGVVIDFYSLSTELIYVDPSINMWSRKN